MTVLERIKRLPEAHQEALAAFIAVMAEKYLVAAEQEINDDIQRIQ